MASNGSNGFSAPARWSASPFYGSRATLAGDVSHDGKVDLVAVNDNSVWVMTSTGTAFNAPALWSSALFYGSRVTLAGDLNGDGSADVIAVNGESVWALLQPGRTARMRAAVRA
jgi:FG-GAP-like repeat